MSRSRSRQFLPRPSLFRKPWPSTTSYATRIRVPNRIGCPRREPRRSTDVNILCGTDTGETSGEQWTGDGRNCWRGLYDTRRSLGSTCLSSVRHECVRERPASSARRILGRLLRFVGSTASLDHGTKVGPARPVGTAGKSRSLKNPLPSCTFCPTRSPRFALA